MKTFVIYQWKHFSSGSVVWRQSQGAEAETVWTCAEEGRWIYWTEHVEDGAARQVEKREITDEARGYSEEGHAVGSVKEKHAMGRVRWRQI